MRWLICLFVLCGMFSSPAMAHTLPPELVRYADTVLSNGKIVVMDDSTTSTSPGTIVEALAIRDGKVLTLGTNKQILAYQGPKTKIIDLKGRTVLPGIIDTHSHVFDYAMRQYARKLTGVKRIRAKDGETWKSIRKRTLDAVKKAAAKRKPGEWISFQLPSRAISTTDEFDFEVRARRGLITGAMLDQLAPKNPVFLVLRTIAGTRGVINARARKLVEETWHGPKEPHLIDDDGAVSNSVKRNIVSDILISNVETIAGIFKKGQLEWASYGITTWASSMRSVRAIAAYQLLDQRGDMGIRVAYAPALGTPLQVIPEMFNTKEGYGSDYLWFIGASTRGVDSSYPSLTTTIEPPAIAKKIKNREVLKAGFLQFIEDHVATGGRFVNTHIAGDKTLDLVMDAIERGSKRAGLSPEQIRAKRHAGDHCTMNPRPDQIPRIKKLGMIMSCSPKYIRRAGKVLRDYGEVFLDWVVPVKSLIDAGVRTVLEIDDRNMGDYGSVFNYIDLLVNRKHKGYTYAGKERIDRVLALKMSTIWAAEYVLREKLLGSLERGKFADLIVLSDDYLTVPTEKIKNIKPVLTVVGGKIVYQAPEF